MELWPNKDLNKFYRDRLKYAEVHPAEDIWERIESELPQSSPVSYWLNPAAWVTGLALILSILIFSFEYNGRLLISNNTLKSESIDELDKKYLALIAATEALDILISDQISDTEPEDKAKLQGNISDANIDDIGQARRVNRESFDSKYMKESSMIHDYGQASIYEQLDNRKNNIPQALLSHALEEADIEDLIEQERLLFTELKLELKNGTILASLCGDDVQQNQNVPNPYYDDETSFLDLEEEIEDFNVVSIGEVDPKEKLVQAKNQVFRDLSLTTGFFISPMFGSNATWMLKAPLEPGWESTTTSPEYAMKFGKKVGLITGYDFNTKYGVETGLIWSDGGYLLKRNIFGFGPVGVLKLNYIEAPILFKYKMTKVADFSSKPMVVNYKIGLKYGYLVKGTVENLSNESVSMSLHRHKWGLVGGLDVDIYMSRTMYMTLGTSLDIQADGRYFPRYRNTKDSPITMNWSMYVRFNLRSSKK